MKVGLCFGGPSDERNISAGSLKPWVTWLQADPEVVLEIVFFGRDSLPWLLPEEYAFTNTCEDFESQLPRGASLDRAGLEGWFQEQDVVVPLVHGALGEDGELTRQLEQLGVSYPFSSSQGLARTFDKRACYQALAAAGLPIPESIHLSREDWRDSPEACHAGALEDFELRGGLLCAIKPNSGGSSLGVSLVDDSYPAFARAMNLALEQDDEVLIEGILEGLEFSVIVLETRSGPVALAPTEIDSKAPLYDTRSKYLHGSGTRLHTPLRRSSDVVEAVRAQAIRAWRATGLGDMARVDGFLAPTGEILITDINGISGMGFSSFGFLQTALAGVGHDQVIRGLLRRAQKRRGRPLPPPAGERVHVLFGGPTSERQVSRQSGIFVGLCLAALGKDVRFVFQDRSSRFTEIGLFYALHHDVAEIQELIHNPERRAEIRELGERIADDLRGSEFDPGPNGVDRNLFVGPSTGLQEAVNEADFVFLALHGGPGEDGTLQAALELMGKPYNGCGPHTSRTCADKLVAIEQLAELRLEGIATPRQREVTTIELLEWTREAGWHERFKSLTRQLGSEQIICKPAADGCSTGVKLLADEEQLRHFVRAIVSMQPELLADEISPGSRPLPMPEPPPHRWVFEQALVDFDAPPLPAGDWNAKNLKGWIAARRYVELTCAVCDVAGRGLSAAVPSLTVARSAELSLEEKFQQGVGTNLEIDCMYGDVRVRLIRRRVLEIAKALGIEGYARLDCFYDQRDDVLYLLEVNTLCALTEATAFYSQMLSTFDATPAQALDWIVEAGKARAATRPGPRPLLLS